MFPNEQATSTQVRILIVDPDKNTRALYDEVLRVAGYVVTEASDGRAALTEALMRPPALVLMELRLPLVDGYGLCEVLRADPETRSVPIVVVTGEARERELKRIRAAGANVVLVKPTLPDVVLREVQQCLSRVPDSPESSGSIATAAERNESPRLPAGAPPPRQTAFVKAHTRGLTTHPPLPPPSLLCPSCDRALTYDTSYVGGVSRRHAEQWDYYRCATCGAFQYRQRTRKIRRVDDIIGAESPTRNRAKAS